MYKKQSIPGKHGWLSLNSRLERAEQPSTDSKISDFNLRQLGLFLKKVFSLLIKCLVLIGKLTNCNTILSVFYVLKP